MLNKSGVLPLLWKSLCDMQKNPLFDSYYLVGGTALSLQIGHRMSDDIDLFTKEEINRDAILEYAKKNISHDYRVLNNTINIYQLFSDKEKLKLDFVQLPYDLLDPLIKEEGIRMIDKNDLSAMKINAAGMRGTEAKDFIDIFCLLQYVPFEKMIDNFKKKYQTDDALHYLRSVMYFDDVTKEKWQSLKLINDNISDKMVMERLTKEVVTYEKNILLNINKHR
jgi:hypothetical protein